MQIHLWPFANAFYQQSTVEAMCLAAQDKGANVCLMLCAAWLTKRGIAFTQARADTLIQLGDKQRKEIIEPLRALRIQWRERAVTEPNLANLREGIKKLEFEAERQLLDSLEVHVKTWLTDVGPTEHWLIALSAPAQLSNQELAQWRQLLEGTPLV